MSKKSPYYHTCQKCQANLDPNERCDCEKEVQIEKSETYLIGFDSGNNTDLACLQISKVIDDKIIVKHIYYGEEAENLQNKIENGWYNS